MKLSQLSVAILAYLCLSQSFVNGLNHKHHSHQSIEPNQQNTSSSHHHHNHHENNDKEFVQATTPQPIRITTDQTLLSTGTITAAQTALLKNLIKTCVNFVSLLLKVQPNTVNNKYASTKSCIDVAVPAADKSTGIPNSDLHIYVNYVNVKGGQLANAGICTYTSTITGVPRPNFARVQINIASLSTTNTNNYNEYHNNVMVILHEFIHLLGFQSSSLPQWSNASKKVYGQANIISYITLRDLQSAVLSTPNVLNTARKHYGCQDLPGMLLENEEGNMIGSHWERSILKNEIETAQSMRESFYLSPFTIALLRDTGFWDEVNENLSTPIFWGKNKGCDFFYSDCITSNYEEYSPTALSGCSFNYEGIGTVNADNYSDSCSSIYVDTYGSCEDVRNQPVVASSNQLLSDYQSGSKCFKSSLTYPNSAQNTANNMCHLSECNADFSKITISFSQLPGFNVICSIQEQGLSKQVTFTDGKNMGSIQCPSDFQRFCSSQKCKNFCSFNGFCSNGQCFCNPGYSNTDCSNSSCPKYYDPAQGCVDNCVNSYANPDNTCKFTCPKGYYKNGNVCSQCDFGCSQCFGPSKTQCTSCQFLTYLQGNECVPTCSAGYYVDEANKQCQSCTLGCASCTNSNSCTACVGGFYLNNNNICIIII